MKFSFLVLGLFLAISLNGRASAPANAKANANAKDEGLAKQAVDKEIKKKMHEILGCYDDELTRQPGLSAGKIRTRLLIDGTGKVKEVSVLSSDIENLKVENCVLDVLRAISFPKPAGGVTVDISYPFVFAPADKKKK